jgi:hypothetical protein
MIPPERKVSMPIALTAIPGGAASSRTPLGEIDADIKTAVEDALLFCADDASQRVQAAFETKEAGEDFLREARAYAYQRPAGRVVVSGNVTAKGFARFRVLDYVAPDGETEGESETAETE